MNTNNLHEYCNVLKAKYFQLNRKKTDNQANRNGTMRCAFPLSDVDQRAVLRGNTKTSTCQRLRFIILTDTIFPNKENTHFIIWHNGYSLA